jgi:hypothetical protein
MKITLSALFLLILSYASGQNYKKDSVFAVLKEKEDREAMQNDLKKCSTLINEFKEVNFKDLELMIVNEISFKNIKNNVIINYDQPFSLGRNIIIDSYDYTPVYCNYDNPVYNQSHFWNKKTIKYLQRKFNVNMIPYLPQKGMFVSKKTIETYVNKKDKAISVFLKQKKTEISGNTDADEGEKYSFIPAKGFQAKTVDLSRNNYQEFEINFRNYPGKIVIVRFSYDHDDVYKSYQFVDKAWQEIETKEGYRF